MTTPSKSFFFVYAPDMTDPGALERRLAVRSKHFEDAGPRFDKGLIRIAGAQLDENTPELEGGQKNMVGSIFICEATSIEEIREIITTDIYYTSGVWDKEKLVIRPFLSARPF
ncbi:hypothetical protein CYLTODRAFT_419139 [Cylindrobasidium torrendii FP15055 ss-10]|uniref:YCII-related domain-containing protein n=1 Tax=Cylindrobasidium torrendii FP15055 ss-10 TaxID=1314674 RepID=A0A0D7BNH1_9AGAR|nr:hypothetical protein CYLTODRAFT_419139 [Cylindrobasidium torrendii FP15055 ss-10]